MMFEIILKHIAKRGNVPRLLDRVNAFVVVALPLRELAVQFLGLPARLVDGHVGILLKRRPPRPALHLLQVEENSCAGRVHHDAQPAGAGIKNIVTRRFGIQGLQQLDGEILFSRFTHVFLSAVKPGYNRAYSVLLWYTHSTLSG